MRYAVNKICGVENYVNHMGDIQAWSGNHGIAVYLWNRENEESIAKKVAGAMETMIRVYKDIDAVNEATA